MVGIASMVAGVAALGTALLGAFAAKCWDRRQNTKDNIMCMVIVAMGLWKKMLAVSPDDEPGMVKYRAWGASMAPAKLPGKGYEEETITVPVKQNGDSSQTSIAVHIWRPVKSVRKNDGAMKTFVWMHGGGMCMGQARDAAIEPLLDHLRAKHPDVAVATIDYRMAPGHRFPVPHEDCVAATLYLHTHAKELGLDPHHITLAGCSAGGNLCFTTATAVQDQMPVKFVLCMIPMCNPAMDTDSYKENGHSLSLPAEVMKWFWRAYLGPDNQTALKDDRCNPLLTSPVKLKKLPPICIATARFDPMRDEGVFLFNKVYSAGAKVQHIMLETSHTWFLMANPDMKPLLEALDKGIA
jgi:acetyl esterase/lipase